MKLFRRGGRILIKKILVAIDGSEQSDKALDFALDLASKYSAQIALINVIPFSPISDSSVVIPYGADYATFYKERRSANEKMLAEALNKAKNFQKTLQVTKELIEGRPAEKIVETAKELIVANQISISDIRYIVIGRSPTCLIIYTIHSSSIVYFYYCTVSGLCSSKN